MEQVAEIRRPKSIISGNRNGANRTEPVHSAGRLPRISKP